MPSVLVDEEVDGFAGALPPHAANNAEMERLPAPSSRNLRRPTGERREKMSDSFVIGTLQIAFLRCIKKTDFKENNDKVCTAQCRRLE